MPFVLAALGLISLLECALWLEPLWKRRKVIARLLPVILFLASAALLIEHPAFWTALVAVLSAYRIVNLARAAAGRIQADYLFHASRGTGAWLMAAQLAVAALAGLDARYIGIESAAWWLLAAAAGLICTDIVFISALRNIRSSRPVKAARAFAGSELPSLTVAIPARNETTDLEECLRSLLASTYPKLEIIVLDDCSQDKRTPEIIRGFAHAGVRFIAGSEPPASWLAKNHAYDQLADAANGEVLLFCGVDTRFQPGSLDALVKILLQDRESMVSVMPQNLVPRSWNPSAWFMQPSRYAWELALPRRLLKRPPVLSTCWLITRQALEAAGGFEAVRRKGVPESYLARSTASAGIGYRFLRSDAGIGITCEKPPEDQRATAVRTRYLQLHRRPELTALVSLAELGVLVLPPLLAAVSLISGRWLTAALAGISFAANTMVYSMIFSLTYRRFLLKGLLLLPAAALYDVWLLNYSMRRYEFGEVLWKGRNVCIPVMRAVPKLPEV